MDTVDPTALGLIERIMSEGPISLAEAARILGPRPSTGELRKVATVVTYCVVGVRGGIRLEAIHGIEGWITSRPAVLRFLARLHAAGDGVDATGMAAVPASVRVSQAEEQQQQESRTATAAFTELSGREPVKTAELKPCKKRGRKKGQGRAERS